MDENVKTSTQNVKIKGGKSEINNKVLIGIGEL
jgi:hypothetical protein